MEENILFETQERVGWIRFNRPEKLNAVNAHVLKSLEAVLAHCEEDNDLISEADRRLVAQECEG